MEKCFEHRFMLIDWQFYFRKSIEINQSNFLKEKWMFLNISNRDALSAFVVSKICIPIKHDNT